jgi:hypothetical protein
MRAAAFGAATDDGKLNGKAFVLFLKYFMKGGRGRGIAGVGWASGPQNESAKKPMKQNEYLRQRKEEDLAEIHDRRSWGRSFFSAKTAACAADDQYYV